MTAPSDQQAAAAARLERQHEATARQVLAAVGHHVGVPADALSRHYAGRLPPHILTARQMATCLLREYGLPVPRIAHLLHVKPQTVQADLAAAEGRRAQSPDFGDTLSQLADMLDAHA